MPLKIPQRKVNIPVKPVRVQIPARGAATPSTGYSANDGFARARSINDQRQREFDMRKNRPIEFNMKIGEGGVKGVTIILVDRIRLPVMPHFHYAHRWGFEKKDPKTEICIQDDPAGCGLCRQQSKKGTYEMVLTCIDTRPYTPKHGPNAGKLVARSKKPYVVKTGMIPVFERLYKAHKTFRGMVLCLHRDGNKSPGSGSTAEFVRMLSEAELAKYGPELTKPIDYKLAYPRLTAEQMNEIYAVEGGDGAIGSEDVGTHGDDVPF